MTVDDPNTTPENVVPVELAQIHHDRSWPVDAELVAAFRASIRLGEPPILSLVLNRVWRNDGSSLLDIIDGSHRDEALRLEGRTTHTAIIREYDAHDAFYARIATSIGKSNELFRQRAEQALREGFVRDVASHLEGATLYQRGEDDDGTPHPVRRHGRLPSDPLLALGSLLWSHFAAKPDLTEAWEQYVVDWLEDIASRLGKTSKWLRNEVLGITALLPEDLPGKARTARAHLLLAIPDDGIMRIVLGKLKKEPRLTPTDLRFALNLVGCGPDIGRHPWLKHKNLAEMRGLLVNTKLSQLAKDFTDELQRQERSARSLQVTKSSSRGGVLTSSEAPGLPVWLPVSAHPTPDEAAEPNDQIFDYGSSNFVGTGSHHETQPTQRLVTSVPIDDYYSQAHNLTSLLINAWQEFDEHGGDWTRADVRQDLATLRRALDTYDAHAGSVN